MVDPVSNPATEEQGPEVQQVQLRLKLIGPVRLVLGVGWLVAALVAGAPHKPGLIGFGVGAFWIVFLAFNDPRSRFRRDPVPIPLPPNARVSPAWMHLVRAAYPSTLGVSVLALVSLFGRATLTALLAGILAGLGIGALLSLRRIEPNIYVDPRGRVLYRK
jgi:hypothetical protein